jgi:hypothetical protein
VHLYISAHVVSSGMERNSGDWLGDATLRVGSTAVLTLQLCVMPYEDMLLLLQ